MVENYTLKVGADQQRICKLFTVHKHLCFQLCLKENAQRNLNLMFVNIHNFTEIGGVLSIAKNLRETPFPQLRHWHHKLHLDQFSYFPTAYGTYSVYFTMCLEMPVTRFKKLNVAWYVDAGRGV